MSARPLLLGLAFVSCAGSGNSLFVHPEFDFRSIEAVAVVPFENLSNDQGAANRVTRILISELLSRQAFDVIEPGEVAKVLEKYSTVRTAELQKDQIREIGKALGVQAIFLGVVSESATNRHGNSASNEVALVARLVETEKGTTIWSATRSEGGRNILHVLFGLEPPSKSLVTVACVKNLIGTLIK